jgi:tetratricopeptide (TPR) repeat protein
LLGTALGKQKKYEEAAEQYLAAFSTNPDSAVAHNNLARVRHSQGRLDEASDHYAAALRLDPALAQAHSNFGVLLLQKGQVAEGAAHLREAVRLNPGDAEFQFNLALALNQLGKWGEAAELFVKTVGPSSSDPNAHYQFGLALAHEHKAREAMSQYASALLLQPDFPAALDGLAWILATTARNEFRNGVEAVRMAERACELSGRKDPEKLKTLAAAYAEAGRLPEAQATAEKARDLAEAAGKMGLGEECGRMVDVFRAGKPWRSDD